MQDPGGQYHGGWTPEDRRSPEGGQPTFEGARAFYERRAAIGEDRGSAVVEGGRQRAKRAAAE